MSLENSIFTALASIPEMAKVGGIFAVYPVKFPQPVRYAPEWPAIRYTFISEVPVIDICGDGDDTTTDVRVQIDVVATTHVQARSIRLEVMGVMSVFDPPATLQASSVEEDVDTNTFRCIMDYLVNPSSTIGSP